MIWYFRIAYFFAGAFLANSVPHLVNGLSGKKFPTPFVRPLSSSSLNVWWGFVNLAAGYLLVTSVGTFEVGLTFDSLALLLGVLAMSIFNSIAFGRRKIR